MGESYLHYPQMISEVLRHGKDKQSRLGPTKEIIGFNVFFPLGQLFYRPRMLRALGWLESLHVLSGVFFEGDYSAMVPNLQWDYTLDAAYGPKILEQLYDVRDQLQANPESRRAVVFIGGKEYSGERAKPCISSYQFMVNDGRLDLILTARSWDLISGFLYDTQVAGVLGIAMALSLGIEPGTIYASAGTGHIYMKDVEEGRSPHQMRQTVVKMMRPVPYYFGRPWGMFRSMAMVDLDDLRKTAEQNMTEFCPSFIRITKEGYNV